MCPVIHLIEPVVGAAEPPLIVHHANCQVAAVHIQIKRHTPHHNEPQFQPLNLPGNGPTAPRGSAILKYTGFKGAVPL